MSNRFFDNIYEMYGLSKTEIYKDYFGAGDLILD